MKLEQWALIAEIIGGIAIVVSLLFVGVEVQRTRVAQVQSGTQTVVSEYSETVRLLATDPRLACIYALGVQDYSALSGSRRLRLSAFLNSLYRTAQQMYALYLEGAIEPSVWAGFDATFSETTQLPGLQQWFATREHWFGDEFRDYLNGKMLDQSVREPVIYDDPACSEYLE